MKVICVTRLLGLLCGITELVPMSDIFNKDGVIKNFMQPYIDIIETKGEVIITGIDGKLVENNGIFNS